MNNNDAYKKIRVALHSLLEFDDEDFEKCFELGGLKSESNTVEWMEEWRV